MIMCDTFMKKIMKKFRKLNMNILFTLFVILLLYIFKITLHTFLKNCDLFISHVLFVLFLFHIYLASRTEN